MEVVPFLLLAVGADNVFILIMEIEREDKEGKSIDDVIAKVLGRGGPSMMLCAMTEATVFFIGAYGDMPAVKIFAWNAGFAILFNFILQLSGFLAIVKVWSTKSYFATISSIFCAIFKFFYIFSSLCSIEFNLCCIYLIFEFVSIFGSLLIFKFLPVILYSMYFFNLRSENCPIDNYGQ